MILSAADAACYVAKDKGRGRIHVHQPGDAELASLHGEMQWVLRINRALEKKRFRLAFQAILPLSTERDSGLHCELLVRMDAGDGSLILPGAFLPAAERYNLASKIDRWVISEAFEWLVRHPQVLDGMEMFAINLSGQSLGEEGFLDYVIQQFEETGMRGEVQICERRETTAKIVQSKTAASPLQCFYELRGS